MSFSSSLKDELALYSIDDGKDELSALFKLAGNLSISQNKLQLVFKSENSKTAQKVYKYVASIYNVKPSTTISKTMKLNKNFVYSIIVTDKVNEILDDLKILEDVNLKKIAKNEKRTLNYLRGAFLGAGSVNDPHSSNYHLEIVVSEEDFAQELAKLITSLNFTVKTNKRRNQYIVYMKKAQDIADLIYKMGGQMTYFDFEDIRLKRDLYNSNNRWNNCDIANSVRVNIAANKQIADIELLNSSGAINALSDNLKILANLRLANPEDSLKELATKYQEITDKPITKSGINHLFIKLKEAAILIRGDKYE